MPWSSQIQDIDILFRQVPLSQAQRRQDDELARTAAGLRRRHTHQHLEALLPVYVVHENVELIQTAERRLGHVPERQNKAGHHKGPLATREATEAGLV